MVSASQGGVSVLAWPRVGLDPPVGRVAAGGNVLLVAQGWQGGR